MSEGPDSNVRGLFKSIVKVCCADKATLTILT